MKVSTICTYPAATICLAFVASAQSRPFDSIRKAFDTFSDQLPFQLSKPQPNTIMSDPEGKFTTGIIISDVIGKTQDIAIFSGLTRDIDPVSDRLDDASQNATVLAPDNASMKNLKRKPWEDPQDYKAFGSNAYDGGDGEERAHKNLRRFVESHIIPESPWKEGQKLKTLAGNEIWYESKDGKKRIQPFDVEVTSIADKVANGEVWVLGGSLT
ncbi:hypothetical protein B0J11DRAFT_435559 [Dendryphion nanum]|uniref:FAS1 domain-containing protein n=1 Tax=Dendryphion nanum TaxID=256645 RepID=A0A9P9IKE7_9PLEO|nr:hypothetical protein B0J11DRAFT_435559 [Dendryphion nanum]